MISSQKLPNVTEKRKQERRMSSVPVPILTGDKAGPDHFKSEVAELHQPAVLRGLDLGPCASLWRDPEYVKSHTGRAQAIKY